MSISSLTPQDGTVYFRPHIKEQIQEDIPIPDNVMPHSKDANHEWYRQRITVRKKDSSASVTTSVSRIGGEFTVIDADRNIPGSWDLHKIGFRQIKDSNYDEIAEFDNIIITDDRNGSSKIIYSESFDTVPERMFGSHGTVDNGVFHVSGETFFSNSDIIPSGEPLFRRTFSVKRGLSSARLYATARGYYEFSLNGKKVGDVYLAPGWTDYFYTIMYQTYDVTDMLTEGTNAIGGMLGVGWFSGPHMLYWYNMYGNTQSLLAKLVIRYDDGSEEIIVTNNMWKYNPGPILSDNNYAGEEYDAQYDCEGWNTANYDDSGWGFASIHEAISESVNIVSQIGPPVREVGRFTNPVFTEPLPGKYTYDFGQNIAGFVSVKMKGKKGDRVMFRHGEMLNTLHIKIQEKNQ
jgi:hypothetical protein